MAVCAEAERKKECVGDRDAGESERWWGGGGEGGAAEWRRAMVMSHLLQADRTAEESCHVLRGEGGWGMGTKYVGREKQDLSIRAHLYV